MITFQTGVTINRPVEEVFRFMAEPINYPQWMKGVTLAEPIPGIASGAGSKARVVGKAGPWKMDGPIEITGYESNRKLGISATIAGKMQFQAVWLFESAGPATTRISESGSASLLGFWRLLEPMMGGEIKNGEAEELKTIKRLLEKGG